MSVRGSNRQPYGEEFKAKALRDAASLPDVLLEVGFFSVCLQTVYGHNGERGLSALLAPNGRSARSFSTVFSGYLQKEKRPKSRLMKTTADEWSEKKQMFSLI